MSALQFGDILGMTDVALHILEYLGLKDLYILRCVSREIKSGVDHTLIPFLTKIDLGNKFNLSHIFLESLLPNCSRLQVLILRNYLPITDSQLHVLLENNRRCLRMILFSNLEGINLTAACLQPVLLDQCPRLHTLQLCNVNWLTDGSLECLLLHLNRNAIENEKDHNLRVLDLSRCMQISSRVLNLFMKSKCQLTTLSLSNLTLAVNNETLRTIANNSIGSSLEHLNIINCKNVTAEGIRWGEEKLKDIRNNLLMLFLSFQLLKIVSETEIPSVPRITHRGHQISCYVLPPVRLHWHSPGCYGSGRVAKQSEIFSLWKDKIIAIKVKVLKSLLENDWRSEAHRQRSDQAAGGQL